MTSPTVDEVNRLLADGYPSAYRSGIRCEELGERSATARWAYHPAALRPGEIIPGPLLFGLADVALWFATFTVLGLAPMAVTSDLAITFLRPARGGDVIAGAELIQVGRRRLYGEVRVWMAAEPDRLVAHATGSYVPPT
jgi:uncharacterized protein (TIGR00369 family)